MKPRVFFLGLGTVAVVAAVALLAQHRATAAMRADLAVRRMRLAEAERLAGERRRLDAAQVAPEEIARRREEREAFARMVAQVGAARQRARSEPAAPVSAPAEPPSLWQEEVPAADWRNRGDANPGAALETALWAAAGGDLDTLAGLLVFDDTARAAATELYARVPAVMRSEVNTPEKLAALFTARSVPLGSARLFSHVDEPGRSVLGLQLREASGAARELQITAREVDGHWRLVMPMAAIDRFARQLRPSTYELTPVTVPPKS